MGSPDQSAVFVDTDAVFERAATVRNAFAALSAPTLDTPSTSSPALDAALERVADTCTQLPSKIATSIEAIAQALTVGAIDTRRADGDS